MNRWVGKLAIVTGASSGIGKIISQSLIQDGINVLGLARNDEKLKMLQKNFIGTKGSFHYMKCDIRNEKEILSAFKYAEDQFGGVDILINNAGVFKVATYDVLSTEDMHEIMEVNLIGSVICIRETIKSIRKHNKEGHIININSISGINAKAVPLPLNLSPPSKFALRAVADNLRVDIAKAKDQIRVTSIYCGLVNTALKEKKPQFDPDVVTKTMAGIEGTDVSNLLLYILGTPPHVQIEDLVVTGFNTNK
ncbi:farnesol dehydrogenase-like [Chelonus insularis]|uniref:farnesol dehydrogenase-like n=1 Tax=Chelonus insularis TaxID=460826 RepID=UPI001588D7FF|nr:farnesol dehydrogenase-like [Chelonus insularis]